MCLLGTAAGVIRVNGWDIQYREDDTVGGGRTVYCIINSDIQKKGGLKCKK